MSQREPLIRQPGVECDRLHCNDTIGRCDSCPQSRRERSGSSGGRPCQTPGSVFEIAIRGDAVSVTVSLPRGTLDGCNHAALEGTVHHALERVLAPYFEASA